MAKLRVYFVFIGLIASLMVNCGADKDPSILLRPPHHSSSSSVSSHSSPMFSSSIDSLPVVSSASTNQQSVYTKSPSFSHSSASASASSSDQMTSTGSGGRNNSPWYNPSSSNLNPDYTSNNGDVGSAGNSLTHSSLSPQSGGNTYFEHGQTQQQGVHLTNSEGGYGTPGSGHPSYTYYYQHYPSASNQGWVGDDQGHGGLFGDIGFPSIGAGGGIAGAKAVKIIAILAKGILAVKPFLILGLLLLIAVPVLLLLLPIPIITITGQPAVLRSARSSQLTSYLTQLSGKVLNSEECLERIICKLPQPPEKYQPKVKLIWDEYGSKMVTNERVARGVTAYIETSSQKNKNLKCEQRFKCSNKYL